MSKTLYPKGQFNSWVTNDTYLHMTDVRGKQGNFEAITTTTVGGTEIEITLTAGGSVCHFVSAPVAAAGTLSGTVTVNIRTRESATTVNAGIRAKLYVLSGGVETLVGTGTFGGGTPTELTTTDAAKNFTFTPTSTPINIGDRFVLKLFAINAGGTMAAGTHRVTYSGASAGAAGDTSITFTETWTFNAEPELVDAGATGGLVGGTNGNNVTGNMILVYVSWSPQSVSITSVTDGTNTYTAVPVSKINWHGSSNSSQWFYAKNITGGGLTITANASGGTTASSINTWEYGGVDANPVEASSTASGTSSTSPAGGSVTSTAAYSLIVGTMDNTSGSGVSGNASGFQPLRNTDGTLNRFLEMKGTTSTGSYNSGFTQGSDDFVAATFALKGAYQPSSSVQLADPYIIVYSEIEYESGIGKVSGPQGQRAVPKPLQRLIQALGEYDYSDGRGMIGPVPPRSIPKPLQRLIFGFGEYDYPDGRGLITPFLSRTVQKVPPRYIFGLGEYDYTDGNAIIVRITRYARLTPRYLVINSDPPLEEGSSFFIGTRKPVTKPRAIIYPSSLEMEFESGGSVMIGLRKPVYTVRQVVRAISLEEAIDTGIGLLLQPGKVRTDPKYLIVKQLLVDEEAIAQVLRVPSSSILSVTYSKLPRVFVAGEFETDDVAYAMYLSRGRVHTSSLLLLRRRRKP